MLCVPNDAEFHPTNTGGTAKIYKKYKKNDSNKLDDIFFPLLWKEKINGATGRNRTAGLFITNELLYP